MINHLWNISWDGGGRKREGEGERERERERERARERERKNNPKTNPNQNMGPLKGFVPGSVLLTEVDLTIRESSVVHSQELITD